LINIYKLHIDVDARCRELLKGVKLPCKKGCDGCCYCPNAMYDKTEYEAVKKFFHKHIPLLEKLFVNRIETRKQTDPMLIPCPFLLEAECSMYQFRPCSCRTFFHTVPCDLHQRSIIHPKQLADIPGAHKMRQYMPEEIVFRNICKVILNKEYEPINYRQLFIENEKRIEAQKKELEKNDKVAEGS